MSEPIPLPSGGTVTLRDADDFTYGDIRRIRETIAKGDIDNALLLGMNLLGEIAKAMVVGWELPYAAGAPLPKDDPEVFDRLKPRDAETIIDVARTVQQVLFPPAPTPDDSDKPGSPTEPTDG